MAETESTTFTVNSLGHRELSVKESVCLLLWTDKYLPKTHGKEVVAD